MSDKLPYRVIVTTSDKYIEAILPFAWLMKKYWDPHPEVLVAGFSEPHFPLPPHFSFISMGRMEDYPFNRWSNAVIKLLHIIEDEAFVLMLEDYWINRPVDTRAIRILYDYIIQFKYVIKVDLGADRLYAHGADLEYGTVSYLDLVKSMPGSPYHMSLMPGIWRRELLLKHLIPNESPHDLELQGTTRLSHDQDAIVIGTRQWPVKITLGFRARDSQSLLLDGLKQTDIDEMTRLGLFKPWGKS